MERLNRTLIESVATTIGNDDFSMENARVSLIVVDRNIKSGWRIISLSEGPDAFGALDIVCDMKVGTLTADDVIALMIESTGTGVPVDKETGEIRDDITPVRVKLFGMADRAGNTGTGLFMNSDPDKVEVEINEAEGDLRNALLTSFALFLVANNMIAPDHNN